MRWSNFFVPRGFLSFVFILCVAIGASAQFKASIQGTVKDTGGALVPQAAITVTNTETQNSQQTTSDDEGFYRVSGLARGVYSIAVEKTGYKKAFLERVSVSAEAAQGVDIALEVGEVAATVTVSQESAPLIQTEDANIRKIISTQEVLRLPQSGRDPYQLARLTPGV